MPLDRRAHRLLDMLAAAGAEAPASVADRRAALAALAQSADDATIPATIEDREIEGPGGALPIRVYRPLERRAGPSPALVFFHGGGWVAGGLDTHDGLCRRLCESSGAVLVAVDYRLAPEHPFPAAIEDALAALAWVSGHTAELRIDPDKIAVGGDSVGGGLAAAAAQTSRDSVGPAVALQVLICPILDVAARTPSRVAFRDGHFISRAAFAQDLGDYAWTSSAADPWLSPGRNRDLADLPPALIHTAEYDPFRDEAEAYAAALSAAGVETTAIRHPGMIHYFYAMARAIPYAEAAAAVIGGQMRMAFEKVAENSAHMAAARR
ncbi:MAG TPA: alpha/beta hydrolase [Caulobacteraceae bacterium]|jgi:acetyl esterase/lipase